VRAKPDPYHTVIKALPLAEAENFSVYERKKLEICAGELLRVTSNSRTVDGHRLNNGNLYKVDYIAPDGRLVLENGWRLDKDFAHLQYGYTLTSHAAQGKTVDCVFVAQTARLSRYASDLKQFYVSTSRARHEIKIYTDDIELLKENVSRVRERPMATEILYGRNDAAEREMEEKTSAMFGAVDGQEMSPKEKDALSKFVESHAPEITPDEPASAYLGQEKEIQTLQKQSVMERGEEVEMER